MNKQDILDALETAVTDGVRSVLLKTTLVATLTAKDEEQYALRTEMGHIIMNATNREVAKFLEANDEHAKEQMQEDVVADAIRKAKEG